MYLLLVCQHPELKTQIIEAIIQPLFNQDDRRKISNALRTIVQKIEPTVDHKDVESAKELFSGLLSSVGSQLANAVATEEVYADSIVRIFGAHCAANVATGRASELLLLVDAHVVIELLSLSLHAKKALDIHPSAYGGPPPNDELLAKTKPAAFLEAVRVLLEFVPMDCWQQVFGMCNARRSQTTPDEMQLSVAEFATEVKDRLNTLLEREGLVRFESDR